MTSQKGNKNKGNNINKDIDLQTNNNSPQLYYKKRKHFGMNSVENVCVDQQ